MQQHHLHCNRGIPPRAVHSRHDGFVGVGGVRQGGPTPYDGGYHPVGNGGGEHVGPPSGYGGPPPVRGPPPVGYVVPPPVGNAGGGHVGPPSFLNRDGHEGFVNGVGHGGRLPIRARGPDTSSRKRQRDVERSIINNRKKQREEEK